MKIGVPAKFPALPQIVPGGPISPLAGSRQAIGRQGHHLGEQGLGMVNLMSSAQSY